MDEKGRKGKSTNLLQVTCREKLKAKECKMPTFASLSMSRSFGVLSLDTKVQQNFGHSLSAVGVEHSYLT